MHEYSSNAWGLTIEAGIQRRQWLLLVLLLLIPLGVNALGMSQDVGSDVLLKTLNGAYTGHQTGIPYNPWPEILYDVVLLTSGLGLIAWFPMFVTGRGFFRTLPPPVKLLATFVIAAAVASIFFLGTWALSFAWYIMFFEHPGLGSGFVIDWSMRLILPVTMITVWYALYFSGGRQQRQPSELPQFVR